jgi:hypothetical protein
MNTSFVDFLDCSSSIVIANNYSLDEALRKGFHEVSFTRVAKLYSLLPPGSRRQIETITSCVNNVRRR